MARSRSIVLATLLSLAVLASPAQALPERPLESRVPDSSVYSILRAGDTIYASGAFSRWSPNTGHGAMLDAATGAPDMTWPKINGTVEAAIPDGAGGLFIGGSFSPAWATSR